MNRFARAFTIRVPVAILCGGLFCVMMFFPVLPASGQSGGGREARTPGEAIVKVCTRCHDIEIVMDTPRDYHAWHDTVQKMIDRGATGSPAEFDLVMDYLFENMTTADVNHDDADTLGMVLHASPKAVASIIARREQRPFKGLADLEAAVPGLDRAVLKSKKRMIFFQ